MKIYQGVIVPMVTPINEDYSIDGGAVKKIIDSFINAHCAPFVLGTTGESTSFSNEQKLILVKETVKATAGREKVFAGVSGTSLIESVEAAKMYFDLGVDFMVTTLPYYFPISPDEMLRFFTELADRANCPIIIYNMPAMVGERIPLDVADQLSQHPNIVGVKDSERDQERIDQQISMWKDREDFSFYLGWAAKSADAMLKGADGIVPSTANFVPQLFRDLFDAAKRNDAKEAFRLQNVTDELALVYQKDRKLNTSLPALKVLMSAFDLCQPHAMPPMYNIVQDEQVKLKAQIRLAIEKLL
ncbi:MAG: dihydrodipicolinate synthase family protein [Marinoscillum sp.]